MQPDDLQTMVRDSDEELELKLSEIINLNKQINSLYRQLRIIKSTDGVKKVCTVADKKVHSILLYVKIARPYCMCIRIIY